VFGPANGKIPRSATGNFLQNPAFYIALLQKRNAPVKNIT
jgi:hypothetical protein